LPRAFRTTQSTAPHLKQSVHLHHGIMPGHRIDLLLVDLSELRQRRHRYRELQAGSALARTDHDNGRSPVRRLIRRDHEAALPGRGRGGNRDPVGETGAGDLGIVVISH
jgi:hypothetical protein